MGDYVNAVLIDKSDRGNHRRRTASVFCQPLDAAGLHRARIGLMTIITPARDVLAGPALG